MTGNAVILDLVKRHVLWDNEPVERVKEWPDGLALTTPLRHFVAGSEPAEWLLSREDWVADVVIATRDDLVVEGTPERYGFLLLDGGGEVYLNDAAAVADLGRRLAEGMDPIGYAQVLVQFHPYSSATRAVLTEPDEVRRRFGDSALPEVDAPRVRQEPTGLTFTFASSIRYARSVGGAPLLDLKSWTVEVPNGEPAHWESRFVARELALSGT